MGDFISTLMVVLAILGAISGFKVIFKVVYPHIHYRIYNYKINCGITKDGPKERSQAQEYPWSMLDPQGENYGFFVSNRTPHMLKFTVEVETDESWHLNDLHVKYEQVFLAIGGSPDLISHEFPLPPRGMRKFTFPFAPASEVCTLEITVIPKLNPVRIGIPRIISNYIGEITLKEEVRYFKITADEESVEEYTPYPVHHRP